MRENFNKDMEGFNAIARFSAKGNKTEEDRKKIETTLNWYTKKLASERGSSKEEQKRIYVIERKKKSILKWLDKQLVIIENGEEEKEISKQDRSVYARNNNFFLRHNGEEANITLGEIITDSDWGIKYDLDPKTVPKDIRKEYANEFAQSKMRDFLDKQIMIDQASSDKTHWKKRKAYQAMIDRTEHKEIRSGIIAEKMVKNFLKKLTYDQDVEFEVLNTDAYQDVENKIDFIIKRKYHYRGVKVEESEKSETFGIQFTINPSQKNLTHKQEQIDRAKENIDNYLEDLVLVSVPMGKTVSFYNKWLNNNNPSGGPDKFWSEELKEQVFKGVMEGIFTQEEIDKNWKNISSE